VLDAREPLVRLVEVVEGIAAAVVAVAGDEVLRLRGVHPRRERVRRESGEHDAVGAPIRAHASIAIGSSGIIGMYIVTTSSPSTP